MGEVEIDEGNRLLIIRSHIVSYGNAADEELTERIRAEIETMWNEPLVSIRLNDVLYRIRFEITSETNKGITDIDIYQNIDPKNNYFRIEEFAHGNISFVDGVGSNSGYFMLENLYPGSTTVAHEYGHTIGLDHPAIIDIRGKGVPGIMYPRGTLVDPEFQYDPTKPAGVTGGTMHPMHRRVLGDDIIQLRLHAMRFKKGKALLGDFTNVYHPNHSDYPITG